MIKILIYLKIQYLRVRFFHLRHLLCGKVWNAAVTQLFFSLATGMGSIIMFASYNNFRHNLYR